MLTDEKYIIPTKNFFDDSSENAFHLKKKVKLCYRRSPIYLAKAFDNFEKI